MFPFPLHQVYPSHSQPETDGKNRVVDSLRAQLQEKETQLHRLQVCVTYAYHQVKKCIMCVLPSQSESSVQLAASDTLLSSVKADLETERREKDRQKDAKISRLLGELRKLQLQLEKAQVLP